jgi:F-type H+-transporting ATPase subunit delta
MVERVFGEHIRIATTIDPSLIGGAVVDAGDTRYDGSIATILHRLSQAMKAKSMGA